VPALKILFRYVVEERLGIIILSAFAAHSAWHWTTERYERLRKFPITLPVIDAAFMAVALRWAIVAVVLMALAWLVGLIRQSRRRRQESS
jgi:hypothetical protein